MKRSKELRLQLPVLLGLDIFAIQPNFIIKSIASRFDISIVGALLKLLSMVKVLTANNHQLS